jgi:fibro-slime domain-containing protein
MIAAPTCTGRHHGVALTVVFGALAAATLAFPPGSGNGGGNGQGQGNNQQPALELTGIVRDFLPAHTDFDVVPPAGYGQYMWNIATTVDQDGKPVFIGGGSKVLSQAHDVAGRPISWTLYDADLGDTPAVPDTPDTAAITSTQTFAEWFRDVPGTNLSTFVTMSGDVIVGGEFHGMFEINEPQFYPIDGILFGNDASHNNFFTFEIVAEFMYDASAAQKLYLLSDDDAWVFVENQLVGDLGGINGSTEQWVDMDRLGLTNGEMYRIRVFKADRSDDSSRFHLITNIPMTSVVPQSLLALFD